MSNVLNVTKKLLSLLKVRYTNQYINNAILSHQDYNSLLAIADTLSKYNVENVAVKLDNDKFDELPEPCIVQVSVNGAKLFYIIKIITKETVLFYDDKNRLRKNSKDIFLNIWTGICLLVEKTDVSNEIDIEKKLAVKRNQTVLLSAVVILFVTWLAFSFFKAEIKYNFSMRIFASIYTLLKLIGFTVGVLLLWFEVDQYNPTLQNFCSGGGKINCNAVLQSKYTKLFNGSLSIIGFSYFFGSLTFLFINKFSYSTLSLLSILSFFTLPIIITSFYYQAIVIKQWCKFCIAFQLTLSAEILIVFFGNFYIGSLELEEIPQLFTLFLLPMIAWEYLKSIIENKDEINIYKRRLKRIKSNPIVFKSLLSKSRKITTNPEGLGIMLNRKNANYNVIKVCSPFCSPCIKAHPFLEELVNDNRINLQLLFKTRKLDEESKLKLISHFLVIDVQGNSSKSQQALDDWYNAEEKDYKVFSDKYPIKGDLTRQNIKIEAMRKWCDSEKITHTPTIFINGYELPSEYGIEDLKEVLI